MSETHKSILRDWYKTELPLSKSYVDYVLRIVFRDSIPEGYADFMIQYNGGEGPVGEVGYARFWPLEELVQANTDYNCASALPDLTLIGTDGGSEGFGIISYDNKFNYVSVPLSDISIDTVLFGGDNFIEFISKIGTNKV